MNVKREGWAAAVGRVYLARDGREVRIAHFSVVLVDGVIQCDLIGELNVGDGEILIDYDEQGCATASYDPEQPISFVGSVRQPHPLDLREAKQH